MYQKNLSKTFIHLSTFGLVALLILASAYPASAATPQSGRYSAKSAPASAKPIATGVLPAQSNGGPAVVTISGLTVGRQYTIQIQGTYQWTTGWWGDAQWSSSGYEPTCFCNYIPAVRFNEVELAAQNGQNKAMPNHKYTFKWVANSTQLQMYILDSYYWDNSGGLTYKMFAGVDNSTGALISQGLIEAQRDGGPGTVTITGLTVGNSYTIIVRGTYQWTYGWWGDAQWSSFGHEPNCFCTYVSGVLFNEVGLAAENGQTSVDPNHEYTFKWIADSTQLQMYIPDSTYWDNSGALSYWMYED